MEWGNDNINIKKNNVSNQKKENNQQVSNPKQGFDIQNQKGQIFDQGLQDINKNETFPELNQGENKYNDTEAMKQSENNDKNIETIQKPVHPECQELLVRAKTGVYIVNKSSNKLEDQNVQFVCKENNFAQFVTKGDAIIASDNTNIVSYDIETKQIIRTIQRSNIQSIGLSTAQKFLIAVDKIDKDNFIASVLLIPSLESVAEIEVFKYKRDMWPLLKFDEHDELCFRHKGKFIEIMETKNFEIFDKIKVDNIDQFYLSPKRENLLIVCTLVEHTVGYDKTEAKLAIWSYNDLKQPLISKNMEKAQEMFPFWQPNGNKLLIQTQTMHDETGQSYYGQCSLFYFESEKKDLKKVKTHQGPVHDVAWSPNGKNFIVISGYMPANSILFDENCQPIFEYGKHHRNKIIWSHLQRFMVIGGFGNLNGEMEIWDTITSKKAGDCKSNTAVNIQWADDGRYLMTAVLNPRLRVDNHFKIFKYDGDLINKFDFSHTELYDVIWRPSNIKFTDRPPSPTQKKKEQPKVDEKPKKFFRPVGGNGMLSAMMKADKNVSGARVLGPDEDFGEQDQQIELKKNSNHPPGYVAPEQKQKKKRVRKKKDKNDGKKQDDSGEEY